MLTNANNSLAQFAGLDKLKLSRTCGCAGAKRRSITIKGSKKARESYYRSNKVLGMKHPRNKERKNEDKYLQIKLTFFHRLNLYVVFVVSKNKRAAMAI